MRKSLAILILLTVGLPIHGEKESSKSGGDLHQTDKKNPPPPTAKALCVIKQDGTTIACEWRQADPPSYFRRLFSAESLPNLLLFCVGVGGICYASLTLRQVSKQSSHMERQANIQEASMRQWIDIELADVKDNVVDVAQPNEPTILTHIKFKVFNNTPLPVTIKRVVTNVSGANSIDWQQFVAEETTILPPKIGRDANTYPFFAPITLMGAAANRYLEGKSTFSVSGKVEFVEATGKASEQGFSYVVSHRLDGYQILEFMGKHPIVDGFQT